MFKVSAWHGLFVGLATAILLVTGLQYAAPSFFLGGVLILFTFLIWGLALTLIFKKKFVAVAVAGIVIKYAISGVIIYWLVRKNWLEPLWLALGVFSFAVASLVYSVLEVLKEGRKDGI